MKSTANQAFSTVAYLYLAWLGSVGVLSFFVIIVLYMTGFQKRALAQKGPLIVPDFNRTDDRRRGMDRIGLLFEYVLIGAFVTYGIGWTIAIQNEFLRSDSPDIFYFFFHDFIAMWKDLVDKNVGEAVIHAIRPGQNRTSQGLVVFVAGLVIFVCLILSMAFSLKRLVKDARNNARALADDPDGQERLRAVFGDAGVRNARDPKYEISEWPLGWGSLNVVMGFVLMAVLSVWFYKFGIFLMAVGMLVLGRRFLRLLKENETPIARGEPRAD